jgi:peptide-methionine (S)-S-oxide reductase
MFSASDQESVAVLGGGCFWCLEPIFADLQGVEQVLSGYSGGTVDNPSYQAVCTGGTGHAEVIQITFDHSQISYSDLLRIFFTFHDPTTLNRQGADVGTQYRSIILYMDESQEQAARNVIREIESEGIWKNPIVTEVVPFEKFFKAEDYHQEYYANNPDAMYCRAVISPKVKKFREEYAAKLKSR